MSTQWKGTNKKGATMVEVIVAFAVLIILTAVFMRCAAMATNLQQKAKELRGQAIEMQEAAISRKFLKAPADQSTELTFTSSQLPEGIKIQVYPSQITTEQDGGAVVYEYENEAKE